ncbi:MAG: hypothetical protein IPL20_01460 [Saprospiraceae bacterium]|nr:hypothetical protein [Saprospiraceae bacterium]
MCWYPSIEINTEIIGGMSGGPTLIKETNEIIGVNSRSFNFPEGPGYSTWIGEAMTNVFSFNAKIVYEDNSEFDLREFTLKEIIEFSSKRDNLNHKLAMV